MVVGSPRKKELQKQVREHVEAGSAFFSDELKSYDGLETDYQYTGTYISVGPFHLFRYIDEQAFRYNTRKETNYSER